MIKKEHKRGDTLKVIFVFRDKDTKQPLDLTGCTFRMHIRTRQGRLLAEATSADGLITSDDLLSGEVVAIFPAAITATFPIGLHQYDIEATFSDGFVLSSETVQIKILQDETWPSQ